MLSGRKPPCVRSETRMETFLLLAQSTETVKAGVSILQTIIQGGAALILACVAVVLGWAYWKQLQGNNVLEKDFRTHSDSTSKERLQATETLLREMLDRDREANEAQRAATTAVQGFADTLKLNNATLGNILERIKDIERRAK